MTTVSLTLNFPDAMAAADALARLNGTLSPLDNPSAGATVAPAAPAVANPFVTAAAAAPVVPTLGEQFIAAIPGATIRGAAVAPLPPPAAPAATLPTAATVQNAALDAKGLPWDGRIHASTRTHNKDGTWRQKRDLPETLLLQVEGELKAGQAARAPVAPAAVPSVPAPPATAAPSPAESPAPASAPIETFGQLMARLAPLTMGNPENAGKLNEALAAFGLQSLASLAGRADLLPAFASTIDAMLAVPA